MKEFGVAWIPSLLWRMDQFYESYKLESSWLRKWPSDYVHENIKFSTQPIETSRPPTAVAEMLQTVDGMEDLLCFSSDYPHISFDDPTYVARLLPKTWRHKIFMTTHARSTVGTVPLYTRRRATGHFLPLGAMHGEERVARSQT